MLVPVAGAGAIAYAGVDNANTVSWGDVPTWLGSVATVGLLIGAVLTVYYARKAFLKQAEQLTMLERQAEADTVERLRSQARLVYIQLDDAIPADRTRPAMLQATLMNSSEQLYDVAITWSTSNGQFRDARQH